VGIGIFPGVKMENLKQYYQIPKEWENYGDSNPERYGGLFVKWDNTQWHIVETTHYTDIHDSVSTNEHMFKHMYIKEMDIWKNGNPYNGFTDRTYKGLMEFSDLPFDPIRKENSDSEIPDSETYDDYVVWYMDTCFEKLLPYLVSIYRQWLDKTHDFSSNYWKYLEREGIEKENF
jgi:hypothetical protein